MPSFKDTAMSGPNLSGVGVELSGVQDNSLATGIRGLANLADMGVEIYNQKTKADLSEEMQDLTNQYIPPAASDMGQGTKDKDPALNAFGSDIQTLTNAKDQDLLTANEFKDKMLVKLKTAINNNPGMRRELSSLVKNHLELSGAQSKLDIAEEIRIAAAKEDQQFRKDAIDMGISPDAHNRNALVLSANASKQHYLQATQSAALSKLDREEAARDPRQLRSMSEGASTMMSMAVNQFSEQTNEDGSPLAPKEKAALLEAAYSRHVSKVSAYYGDQVSQPQVAKMFTLLEDQYKNGLDWLSGKTDMEGYQNQNKIRQSIAEANLGVPELKAVTAAFDNLDPNTAFRVGQDSGLTGWLIASVGNAVKGLPVDLGKGKVEQQVVTKVLVGALSNPEAPQEQVDKVLEAFHSTIAEKGSATDAQTIVNVLSNPNTLENISKAPVGQRSQLVMDLKTFVGDMATMVGTSERFPDNTPRTEIPDLQISPFHNKGVIFDSPTDPEGAAKLTRFYGNGMTKALQAIANIKYDGDLGALLADEGENIIPTLNSLMRINTDKGTEVVTEETSLGDQAGDVISSIVPDAVKDALEDFIGLNFSSQKERDEKRKEFYKSIGKNRNENSSASGNDSSSSTNTGPEKKNEPSLLDNVGRAVGGVAENILNAMVSNAEGGELNLSEKNNSPIGSKENPIPNNKVLKSEEYYAGDKAVAKVTEIIGRPLTPIEKRVVELEGYVDGYYKDNKGTITRGVGQRGGSIDKDFIDVIDEHIKKASQTVKDFDTLPDYLKAELVQHSYLKDSGASGKLKSVQERNTALTDAVKRYQDELNKNPSLYDLTRSYEVGANDLKRLLKDGVWTSSDSPEGKLDTIAWGHKLTKEEVTNKEIHGEEITFSEGRWHISEASAEIVFEKDVSEAMRLGDIPKDWSDTQKRIAVDASFRLGGPTFKKTELKKAIEAEDWAEAYKQIADLWWVKKEEGKPGEIRFYSTRNKKLFDHLGITITEEMERSAKEAQVKAEKSYYKKQKK